MDNDEIIPARKLDPFELIVGAVVLCKDITYAVAEYQDHIVQLACEHANYRQEQRSFRNAIRNTIERL